MQACARRCRTSLCDDALNTAAEECPAWLTLGSAKAALDTGRTELGTTSASPGSTASIDIIAAVVTCKVITDTAHVATKPDLHVAMLLACIRAPCRAIGT